MNNEDKFLKKGLIASLFFHALIAIFFFFGMPTIFERFPDKQDFLTFEVVNISDINTPIAKSSDTKKIKKEQKNTRIIPKASKKPAIKQSEKQVQKQSKKLEPKKDNKKIEKIPEKQNKNSKKPKKQEIKKAKETKKKEITKKQNIDPIESILKNLEEESKGNKVQANEKKLNTELEKKDKKSNEQSVKEASINAAIIIQNKIEQNWINPVNTEDISGIKIIFNIKLSPNGDITSITEKEVICPYGSSSVCKIIAQSAMRSIKQSSPIENLPKEFYNSWKEKNIEFDPSMISK